MKKIILFLVLFLMLGCSINPQKNITPESEILFAKYEADKNISSAILAGGCFWCMEGPFESEDGVYGAFAGYTGGDWENPTSAQVMSKITGHREAVKIFYDPQKISYEDLLQIYWRQIDPLDAGGQFFDRGTVYKTAIFYTDETQKKLAEQSKADLAKKLGETVAVEILPAKKLWLAEEYHQDYYLKASGRYEQYKEGSGRGEQIRKNYILQK